MKEKKPAANERTKRNKENRAPVPEGTLIVIGGHENKGEDAPDNKKKPPNFVKLEVLKTFRDAIGKENPQVEVITTATGLPGESFEDYKKVFDSLGITNVGHIHHTTRQEVLDDPLLERIRNADAFFFTGGDQLLLTAIYGGSLFLTELKERYIHTPIVIGGTSAGAMALSTPMIYAGDKEVQELGGEIKVTLGLEFIRDVCIDTHFVHRGRLVRLAHVVITNPTSIGVGIEEDTSIVVKKGKLLEVVGTGLVIIIEGFEIKEASIKDFTTNKPITARNLNIHLLSDGDKYEFRQINPPHK